MLKRAKLFVMQLDVIVDFCTGLMNKMQDMAEGEEDDKADNAKARDRKTI